MTLLHTLLLFFNLLFSFNVKKYFYRKENISLYSLKNNLIGDPSNIDKTCQLTSYSAFLTVINQMVTNARKYYGQNSNMHNASKELLDNAKTAVHDSRDNLKSWLTMSNVSFTCFSKRKKGERVVKLRIWEKHCRFDVVIPPPYSLFNFCPIAFVIFHFLFLKTHSKTRLFF